MDQDAVIAQLRSELQARQQELGAAREALAFQAQELGGQQAELTVLYRSLEEQNEELRHHNDHLDLEVAKRTRELTVQVVETQRINALLAESDRYKDEFLGIVSHELRTPLNFIMAYASVLEEELEGPLNPAQVRSTGRILQGAERLLVLVDDLLDSSNIQAGRFTVDPAPTHCAPLLAELKAAMGPLAERKGIELSVSCGLEGTASLDGKRIAQVLVNLVSNAIKFTPAGGSVALSLVGEGDRLLGSVTDTGIGIAPDDLPLLFTRFKQLDGTATREAGGTGLGLAISRAIVEAHGGTLEVESVPGRGTTFRFCLPRAATGLTASRPQAPRGPG